MEIRAEEFGDKVQILERRDEDVLETNDLYVFSAFRRSRGEPLSGQQCATYVLMLQVL